MDQVLIVDDDSDIRAVLRLFVEQLGCIVIEASNGKIALDIMYDNPSINAIITDLMMPVMHGRELVQILRGHDMFKKVPILVVSAVEKYETVKDLIDLGASSFIPKPFQQDQIVAFLHLVLPSLRNSPRSA
jgi:CheY-like chemotaxis protein